MILGWFRGQLWGGEPGAWCMDGKCLRYDVSGDVAEHCGLTPSAKCWVAMNTRVEIKRGRGRVG